MNKFEAVNICLSFNFVRSLALSTALQFHLRKGNSIVHKKKKKWQYQKHDYDQKAIIIKYPNWKLNVRYKLYLKDWSWARETVQRLRCFASKQLSLALTLIQIQNCKWYPEHCQAWALSRTWCGPLTMIHVKDFEVTK